MLLMNYLLLFISSFIQSPLLIQLELFRTALLCFMGLGALVQCCKCISGHFSLDFEIVRRRNSLILILYKTLKDPYLCIC